MDEPLMPAVPYRSFLGTKEPPQSGPALASRDALLREMHAIRQNPMTHGDVFLVVINIADTKAYDEIIRIFGYKFADAILSIRLENLASLTKEMKLHQVGFWSIGIIFKPAEHEVPEAFFDALVDHFAAPIICRGIPIPIKAGIGVCRLSRGLGSTEDLLQATYIAGQTSGRMAKSWATCNYSIGENHQRAFSLIADISYALAETQEFELCFQPRRSLKTGNCVAAEALLRWRHPTFGAVTPHEFIPLAEITGLIRELTEWVLTRAVAQAANWHRNGFHFKVAVNISVRNLEEVDFVNRVREILARFGFASSYLELEISESQNLFDPELARIQLTKLRELGISVSVDDFGTGTNSFTYLQTMPVRAIKIDDSLVQTIKNDPKNQAVVKSMIGLAHSLGVECVAEGVENQEALLLLTNWGCDYAQGYFLGRPMYAGEFDAWCRQNIVYEHSLAGMLPA
jgi:EAL domain-containing protein (putative c-di-GMP-specific phosphodiesterase class I)